MTEPTGVKEQSFRNNIVSLFATYNEGEGVTEREQRILEAVLEKTTSYIHQHLHQARQTWLRDMKQSITSLHSKYITESEHYKKLGMNALAYDFHSRALGLNSIEALIQSELDQPTEDGMPHPFANPEGVYPTNK